MSENKSCGNCKYMENQDLDGFGWCDRTKTETHCALSCDCYESLSGWTEITPDNVEEVREVDVGRLMIAVITNGEPYYMEYREMFRELTDMAKLGGYYYYVLPELKISNE